MYGCWQSHLKVRFDITVANNSLTVHGGSCGYISVRVCCLRLSRQNYRSDLSISSNRYQKKKLHEYDTNRIDFFFTKLQRTVRGGGVLNPVIPRGYAHRFDENFCFTCPTEQIMEFFFFLKMSRKRIPFVL